MQNILVTGGGGFIGSAFVRNMITKYPQYTLVVLDKLTYAGNLDNLLPVADKPNYRFEQADIADRERVRQVLAQHNIDRIVNFSPESHVDPSILHPDPFVNTRVMGA